MGMLITELNEVLHIVSCLNYIYSSLDGDTMYISFQTYWHEN